MNLPKKCKLCIDIHENIRKKKCTKQECDYYESTSKAALIKDCFMVRKNE